MLTAVTAIVALLGVCEVTKDVRASAVYEQRRDWAALMQKYRDRKDFHRHLRTHPDSFDRLLSMIRESLVVNTAMANLRGGPILPEIKLCCAIRWLAGGSYSDIHMFVGITRPSFCRVVWQVIRAINNCTELNIIFPATQEDFDALADGFTSLSTGEAITNCVGVIDGHHLEIEVPPKDVVGNVRSYYSGHYKTYGVNVQAIADYNSRFLYVAVAGPGSMNDNDAARESEALFLVESVPFPYVIIGDCAYVPTERMVPTYGGIYATRKNNDSFNYYASQLRTRVEMAFGLMSEKWGILWRPLKIDITRVKELVVCIARLHNFCINERLAKMGDLETYDASREYGVNDRGRDINVAETSAFLQACEIEDDDTGFTGYSAVREEMVRAIHRKSLFRPEWSTRRRRSEEQTQ